MGRKPKQELSANLLMDDSEVSEIIPYKFASLEDCDKNELTMGLYQFAKLVFDNVKIEV